MRFIFNFLRMICFVGPGLMCPAGTIGEKERTGRTLLRITLVRGITVCRRFFAVKVQCHTSSAVPRCLSLKVLLSACAYGVLLRTPLRRAARATHPGACRPTLAKNSPQDCFSGARDPYRGGFWPHFAVTLTRREVHPDARRVETKEHPCQRRHRQRDEKGDNKER